MFGSQFLSAHTMLHSLLSSWVDQVSQPDSSMEGQWSETITTCLVAMVSCSLERWRNRDGQLHDLSPENIIMLALMVMLFIGNKSDAEFRREKKLLSAYGAIYPEVYESVKHCFHELRVANGIDNPSSPKQLE